MLALLAILHVMRQDGLTSSSLLEQRARSRALRGRVHVERGVLDGLVEKHRSRCGDSGALAGAESRKSMSHDRGALGLTIKNTPGVKWSEPVPLHITPTYILHT